MIFTRHQISKYLVQRAGSPEIPTASMESIFRISVNCTKPASFHLPPIPCPNRHCCLPPYRNPVLVASHYIGYIFPLGQHFNLCATVPSLALCHTYTSKVAYNQQPTIPPRAPLLAVPIFPLRIHPKASFPLNRQSQELGPPPPPASPLQPVDRHSLSLSNLFPQLLLLLLYRTHTDQTFHPLQFILARPTELFSCSCSTKATRTHLDIIVVVATNSIRSFRSLSVPLTAYNYQTTKMLYRTVIAAQLVPSHSDLLAGGGKAVRKIEMLRAIHRPHRSCELWKALRRSVAAAVLYYSY